MPDFAPKVSIITVCFNAEKYIERTIESVISQTYPNIEYVIIDGKSKDRTVEIIKKYEQKILYWVSEKDKSLYDAMNKGLKAATGDYVWFVNAGDRIHNSKTLQQIIDSSNNEDFIYGDVIRVDESGNERKWYKKTPGQGKLSARSFLNGMVVCHQSMIVKRTLAPGFDLNWKLANDIDWSISVLKQCKTTRFVDIPFCYFLEGGFSAHNRWTAVSERFIITKNHFGIVPAVLEQFKVIWQVMKRGGVS